MDRCLFYLFAVYLRGTKFVKIRSHDSGNAILAWWRCLSAVWWAIKKVEGNYQCPLADSCTGIAPKGCFIKIKKNYPAKLNRPFWLFTRYSRYNTESDWPYKKRITSLTLDVAAVSPENIKWSMSRALGHKWTRPPDVVRMSRPAYRRLFQVIITEKFRLEIVNKRRNKY